MENSSNGSWGKIILTIAGVIAVIAIAVNWDKIVAWFKGAPDSPKSDYDKCVQANSSKRDGESCVSCRPDGAGMASFEGTIKDGVCERVSSQPRPAYSNKVQVTKTGGTRTLVRDGAGNIVSPQNANIIPYGTVLTVIEVVTSPATYYNTTSGWIDANDVTVVAQ